MNENRNFRSNFEWFFRGMQHIHTQTEWDAGRASGRMEIESGGKKDPHTYNVNSKKPYILILM